MNLYVGGAGQGKTEYVLQKLQAEPVVIQGEDLDDWIQTKPEVQENQPIIITHFEVYILSVLQEMQGKAKNEQDDNSTNQFSSIICNQLDALMRRHPYNSISIICNEIGNGIVPMDPEERLWREVTGRVLIHLAREADHFERVIAGMGQVIK